MLAGEGQGACLTAAFSLNATMVWWSVDAGAAFRCFYVAELLWMLGCMAELQTGKDNEVFYLWLYDIFEKPTSSHQVFLSQAFQIH